METGFMNRIIGLVLALVVGGLLVGGLLIPSIEGMTATEKTLTNEGYYRMSSYDVDTPVTFSWSYDKPNVFVTNDVEYEVNLTAIPPATVTIVGDTNWMIRGVFGADGVITQLNYVGSSGAIIRAQVSDQATVNLTMENGLMNGTVGTSTLSNKAYSQLYIIDKNGPFIMKDANESAHLKSDSSFFAYGNTIIESAYLGLEISGNIENGANVIIWRGESGFTTDEPTLNYVENTQYIDVYDLSTITLNATRISDETVTAITYSYFVVPYQVTAELSQHLDATQIAMFGVISILGIVALVVVAANGIRNKY